VVDDAFIEKHQIDYVAHDEENYVSAGHEDLYHHVKSIGVLCCCPRSGGVAYDCSDPGKFMPTRRTPGVSTSELLKRIVSGYRTGEFDDKLIQMGSAELRAGGSGYDDRRVKGSRSEMNGVTKR
jgi:choline-phosphate cytidylyltransferase